MKSEKIDETRPHRKLDVWKKSLLFAKQVYGATEKYPASEVYGLVSQMRRASVSIPSNLAEGAARKGKKEFLQFINVAQGSLSELDTQIELSMLLNYISRDEYEELTKELRAISRMLFGLAKSVKGETP